MIDPYELERASNPDKHTTIIERIQECIRTVPGFLAQAFQERSRSRESDGRAIIGAAIEYVQTQFSDRGEVDKAALREAFIAGHTLRVVADETEAFEAHLHESLPPSPDVPDAA